jgi:hypothetical protein
MQKAFQKKGYWVYVDNSESKGFFDYDGIYTSLDDFNIKYNIQGELYNSLVKWRELYPDQNIAITGYLNIVRGITFNTTGFNFTDAILSAYHMKNVAELIQLFGRANGGKEYVQVMNIYCPDCVWKCADDQIQIMAELHNKNPAEFEEKDFRPVTKKDLMEKAWTVPSVFPIRPDAWKNIRKIGNGKKWDKDSIFREIEKCAGGEEIVKEIRNRDCFQCTQPEKEDTYKKYVTDFIKKSCEKEKYNMGLHKPDKVKDGYQIFLDNKGHNIIVSIYNGSLIPRQAFEEENEETPNNTPTEENSEV